VNTSSSGSNNFTLCSLAHKVNTSSSGSNNFHLVFTCAQGEHKTVDMSEKTVFLQNEAMKKSKSK
jgi:hypothetical protein